jgi:tetratricopeptide (TPR) repeat protein
MYIRVRLPSILLITLYFSGLCSSVAMASETVFGNGLSQVCADAAHNMEKGIPPKDQSLEACNTAIAYENLPMRDLAGTYINRGVLYLARGGYREAKQDFDSAAALQPALGEAYTNRGAALVGMRHYADAIADLDRGLALNTGEPEKAYFNRGLAEEGLDNIQGAYRDYSRAAELKPDWVLPRNELSRFTVSAPGT